MIRDESPETSFGLSKPRASGDDPQERRITYAEAA